MKKLLDWLAGIPHLFAKLTVTYCILCGTAFSYYTLRIASRTGHDATAALVAILGFFGGELLFMCLRTILSEKKSKTKDQGDTPGKDET